MHNTVYEAANAGHLLCQALVREEALAEQELSPEDALKQWAQVPTKEMVSAIDKAFDSM